MRLQGAPGHTTEAVSEQLANMFGDRLGPWNWHPKSSDLTSMDLYLYIWRNNG